MIKKETLKKILWATIESHVGAWEIAWELNTIFPNNSESDNKIIAKRILEYFFNEGLIEFYKSKWGISNSEFEEINIDNIVNFLNKADFFNLPAIKEGYICMSSTKKGERVYDLGDIGSLD